MAMPRVVEFDSAVIAEIQSHAFELDFSLTRVTGGAFRLEIIHKSSASSEALFDNELPTNNKRYVISDLLFALRDVFNASILVALAGELNLYRKASTTRYARRSGAA